MKLKLDENGHVVVKEGKPVYTSDDGSEIPFDAPGALSKISELNAESANHRRAAKDLKTQLSVFEDIDPVKAREALKTLADLDDKKLVDAGKIDDLKRQLGETFSGEKKALQDQLSSKDQQIRKLTVSSQFAQSDFLKSKTVLTPDIAESAFGKYFSVEENNGEIAVIAKLGDNPIFSREKPGEYASFEEAISTIISSRSDKDHILRSAGSGGSGAAGGSGHTNGHTNPWSDGNRTAQAALIKKDPVMAKRLATEAGAEIPGLNT